MIDVRTASEFLDFASRIGEGQRAEQQLEGAVAVHNLLESRRVAYLADEVGMGKTYVALGAMALFRHFQPEFRVLIIAPRENIQVKWMKEMRNFVAHNVRYPDMAVKAIDGLPARPLVSCHNLLDLVHEVTIDGNRDFFLRLSSFSLAVSGKDTVDPDSARRLRNGFRRYLPWMRDEVFDLRNKQGFKDNFARALCCALPIFDLVIVDEGHNLKHGFGEKVAARNRILGIAMGHPDSTADVRLFPRFGPRARRVLFLSATPVEETYRHLWNQLDVFGLGAPYAELLKADVEENYKKALAGQFLIRRVTSVKIGNTEYTKNLYRREWRRGGVYVHDEPIRINDDRQRLIVALVQKKIGELLGHERFNSSFQIGMLASFESFLETARLKREENEAGNFDDSDQTDDLLEKEGIDVLDVNRLANSYRLRFGSEMPHPKMDALVESLSTAWICGKKSLVFVRRVASVKELKRKLDERYDVWLKEKLMRELPSTVHARLNSLFKQYRNEKLNTATIIESQAIDNSSISNIDDADWGGNDSFFAWFFRGQGPRGVISGANIQQRFIQRGTSYATFFEENYVADVLGCRPGEVEGKLSDVLRVPVATLRSELQERSKKFFSRAKKPARADRYEAVQASAIEWLKDQPGPFQKKARIVWHNRFESSIRSQHASEVPDIGDLLEISTFFTEIRLRPQLRERVWPKSSNADSLKAFIERELRAKLLASAARLGHGLIDLYIMTICRLNSLELRVQDTTDAAETDKYLGRINEYLDLLERQMQKPVSDREWGIFDELSELATNFELILDVNEPDARNRPLSETVRMFGQLLRKQQPVGGMSGQVNQTLVRQFRMPGYPHILITTDLLQEGEDLHTFCSSVYHYGISWTPSSMEQRIGRIDRVRSQTDRRLCALKQGPLKGEDMLQVYYPHLEDTVEVFQVQRVLERMNIFLRLMHAGLIISGEKERIINTIKEFVNARRLVPQILDRLTSAFPVRLEHLQGATKQISTNLDFTQNLAERFACLSQDTLPGVDIAWEPQTNPIELRGTGQLGDRIQDFKLLIKSVGANSVVKCIRHVGCFSFNGDQSSIVDHAASAPIKIGSTDIDEDRTYGLTVEGEIIFTTIPETDRCRVGMLISRIISQTDALVQVHSSDKDEGLNTFRSELVKEGVSMTCKWARFCRASDLKVDASGIEVHFSDDRRHSVTVEEHDDAYFLRAFVVRQAVVSSLPYLFEQVCLRNQAVLLVGFRIDHRGRLVGEAWVPKVGLTAEEFQLYVRTLAAECDRLEYVLTGRDVK